MGDPMLVQLLERIQATEDAQVLHGLRNQVHKHMEAVLETRPIGQFYEQLNEVHDAVISRAISLSEAKMARLGKGSPPVPYAYLLFGSGGREEQTMSSDQDSGIIYADPMSDSAAVRQYFEELSICIVDHLQAAGYPPCEGNVISSNPEWRLSLSEWKGKLEGWFGEPVWEAVRYLLIIADGRCVYGDKRLADEMKKDFYNDVLKHPHIERRMLDNTMRHKMLIGIFGQFLMEQYGEEAGSLDIKYGAYIPMVNAIRLLSVQMGIRDTSTMDRIARLVELGKFSAEDGAAYESAFSFFMRLRMLATWGLESGMYASSGKLAGRMLTKEMKAELKSHLKVGKRLQQIVFKETMGRLS